MPSSTTPPSKSAAPARSRSATRLKIDPDGLGALDPAVITELRRQIWPKIGDPDELHDALIWLGYLTEPELDPLPPQLLQKLEQDRRAARLHLPSGATITVAAERLPQHLALPGPRRPEPRLRPPPALDRPWEPDLALIELLRSRLEGLGPATAARFARELDLRPADAAAALTALEAEGFVLRGHFSEREADEEFCERGLLARIHRGTLHRLRQEIAPVSVPEYIRFLLAWHQVSDDPRPSGPEALALALSRLEGFEAPAAAWEAEILPARLRRYDPAELDALTHSGALVWARLGVGGGKRASAPVRTTPIVLLPRERAPLWLSLAPKVADPSDLSAAALALYELLSARGALFFGELQAHSRLLRAQVEEALAELVARGLASSDGFFGIRGLIAPKHGDRRRRQAAAHPPRPGLSPLERAGRWSCVPRHDHDTDTDTDTEQALEAVARALLRRYGVVFRALLARERALPAWRLLLRVYRRLEARGELRGGYFVEGAAAGGEHFALPEAIGLLRAERRRGPDDRLVCVAAADPLCLLGVITPGDRLPNQLGARLLYRGGIPVATLLPGGHVHRLVEPTREDAESLTRALLAGP
jgi:ATP-dependent Lhr-like helicase